MSAIDYDLTKVRGVVFDVDGVLSPSTIPLSPEGEPLRMVNIKDGYAIQLAVRCGLKLAILSGAKNEGIGVRYKSLGIKDIYMGAAHKLPLLQEWIEAHGMTAEQVIYVGDDIPDLRPLRHVGLPCCPFDAVPEVKATCRYISRFSGGYGVARDILEQVLKAQGCWMHDHEAFGW